jgi:hypothetical protein
MADTYNTVVLAQRPKGDIVPGETFKLKTEKRPTEADLKDGQVIVEARYLSLDPAMRGWLNGMSLLLFHFVPCMSEGFGGVRNWWMSESSRHQIGVVDDLIHPERIWEPRDQDKPEIA